MSVELRDFIKQTLLDIVGGVTDAQSDPNGKYVVPGGIGGQKYPGSAVGTVIRGGALITVSFDVAVTAETGDTAKGGGGFKVAVLGMGGWRWWRSRNDIQERRCHPYTV